MKKIVCAVLLAGAVSTACLHAQELFTGKDGSIRNVDTRAMVADSGEVYLATRSEIYRAQGDKGRWEEIFALPSGENEITCMGGNARTVFAGTRRGLYRSQDFGKDWKNVFRTIIPEKSSVLWVDVSRSTAGKVVIGTEKGVFASNDGGERWQDVSSNLKNRQVGCVAFISHALYACAEDGLYIRKGEVDGWERLVIRSAVEPQGEDVSEEGRAEEPDDSEETDQGRTINCIASKDKRLYIGLDKKILYSDDAGKSWGAFPSEGLDGIVNHIRPSLKSDKLYCATTKGVFVFVPGAQAGAVPRWQEIYKGTDKVFNANSLVYGDETEKFLWALTDKGLYRLEWAQPIQGQTVDVERQVKTFRIMYDREPSFKELQKAAMKFAEVEPDKIKEWRSQARLKALAPKVSFGIDHGTSSNAEIYTSATQKYVVEGPADLDDGWDVSVSWELADLIWSTDQTSIDVRSRLTTQLRNDILDDLRRAYFERKRILYELITNPPQDQKLKFEKELRVQELTQAIDDLTGNFLTEHTAKESEKDAVVFQGEVRNQKSKQNID